jgi:hypothetical protein
MWSTSKAVRESAGVADLAPGVSSEDKPKAGGTADEGGGTEDPEGEAMGEHDGLTVFTTGGRKPVVSGVYRLRAGGEVGVRYNVSEDQQWPAYVTVIVDLWDRKVIGRAFSEDMEAHHGGDALMMACTNRRPEEGLLFHSDRRVQQEISGCAFGTVSAG